MNPREPLTSLDELGVDRYLSEIAHLPPLSAAAEGTLVLRLPKSEAVTALIEGSLFHVVQIARQYQGQGVPLMDLIGEGNLCLVQMVHTFSPERAASFRSALESELHHAMEQALSSYGSQDAQVPFHQLDTQTGSGVWWRLFPSSSPAYRPPEDILLAQEAYAGISAFLRRLSCRQRLTLAHYYGFVGQVHGSYAALSREWGIRASGVRDCAIRGMSKLRYARQELSEFLGDIFPYLF